MNGNPNQAVIAIKKNISLDIFPTAKSVIPNIFDDFQSRFPSKSFFG